MARALLADPGTKTLSVSLTGLPAGLVTLVIRRKGHGHGHHYSHSFGPRDKCGLPSVRVFDCGHCGHCDACKPSVTPCHAGRVDVDECADCSHPHNDPLGGHGHHHGCGHCGGHGCGHCHDHGGPSVTYTGAMSGCTATFTLDENIHDAPSGYYTADLFDGKAKLKTFTMVVRGSGLRANVTAPAKGC